jgi:exodeoxyribonuclease VII large subunit
MDLFSPAPPPAPKPLTVSQITRRVRDTIEGGFRSVWVEGEISNFRRQSSGHCYFTLKDSGAQLACVLFKGNAQLVRTPLSDGMAVLLQGDLTVYEARGQYQMVVKRMQAAGAGSLQLQFEALKRRLAAEGLFDADRKQPILRMPSVVAIVTSPTGAALQDMIHVLTRRAPWLHILIAPVRVQGIGAAEEIAAALGMLASESGRSLPAIDTIVTARGGGSIEDLWAFNEEIVARAMHACPIPVINAVGHEIDFTIADFAADLRAPTPSAAAELLTRDRSELLDEISSSRARMDRRLQAILTNLRRVLELSSRGALRRDPERILLPWRQNLDSTAEALAQAVTSRTATETANLREMTHRLGQRRPDRILAERRATLAITAERLHSRSLRQTERRSHDLSRQAALLRTLGPESTLARGFTCTTNAHGKVVRHPSELSPGDAFQTRFLHGSIDGLVTGVTPATISPDNQAKS